MGFYHKLRSIQERNKSLLCVGLDPDIGKIPKHLLTQSDPIGTFCQRIIESTSDLVCAYKLNLAFFEALGEKGWSAVHHVLTKIPADVIAIGDAKRGDIGNTAEMYARSLFGDFEFGAATVNVYMGEDSVRPFIRDPDRGAFILALTSNTGARDFQYMKVKGKPLYEQVARKARTWNDNRNVGLVVGATRPAQLKRLRQLVPDMPLLIPGVGAQGGDVKLAIRHGCDVHGGMVLVNASRSIIYASSDENFADAARSAATALREEMNRYREKYF